jgi:GNAT superfamily N-acetyltransferase
MPKSISIRQPAVRPQISIEVLKSPEDVTGYIDVITSLADRHRKELGFLPDSVYVEQAAHSHLWVAAEVDAHQLAGFLLYGGTFPHLRIFQLFVTQHARNMGIGKYLVQELVRFGEKHNFLTATAKVAAELPANSFWEQNGFRIVDQFRGGSKGNGRLVNVRLCELDSPALFRITEKQEHKEKGINELYFSHGPTLLNRTYVLDLNVFFDVIRQRLGERKLGVYHRN